MSNIKTISKSYITHEEDNQLIYQRTGDGYVNATAMCKAFGKDFKTYNRSNTTKRFVTALSSRCKICTTDIIITQQGGEPHLQGTWIHPKLAIHLAQYLSPEFAVTVSIWIDDWMSGKNLPKAKSWDNTPHFKRYMMNQHKILKGHFSVLQEMAMIVYAQMERTGYIIPDHIVPDISEGKLFAKLLRDKDVDVDNMPTYMHRYPDGRLVSAKMYPNKYLEEFKSHVEDVWLPEKAHKYFKERDTEALPFLEKALQISEALTLKTIANA
jgi:hypothetical protein